MDDHMLSRINEEIKLCFTCAELELGDDENIKDNYQYKSAAILIKAYNSLVKLYYNPEYIDSALKSSVNVEFNRYKECYYK